MKKLTRTFKNANGEEFKATVTVADEGSDVFERTVVELAIKALGNKHRGGRGRSSIHNGFMTVEIEKVGL